MTRNWIFLAVLLASLVGEGKVKGQAPDPGPATASEAEKGSFVRQLLASRKVQVHVCRFARAECDRLMSEFLRGKDVEFVEPTTRSESGQDPAFRETVAPCAPPPAASFAETDELYKETVNQLGAGYAMGPFAVYKLPALADGVYQSAALIRMSEFRFANGILEYFHWTKYARVVPMDCGRTEKDNEWLFPLSDDTRQRSKAYFTDGVVRLGDEFYIFTLTQQVPKPLNTFDPAAGVFNGEFWKLESSLRALSVFNYSAE